MEESYMLKCLILNIIRATVLTLIKISMTRFLLIIDEDMFRPQVLVIFKYILILCSLHSNLLGRNIMYIYY